MSERMIRASDVGQYSYCARAWWLGQVQGLAPANVEELDLGNEFHAAHGRATASFLHLRRLAVILVELAALCLIMALLLWRGGR